MRLKNKCLIVLCLILVVLPALPLGHAAEDAIVPLGMELRVVGQTSLIVPENAKIEEKGGLIIVEAIDKYVARALFEMKQQIKNLEDQQEQLNKKVEQLKSELAK